MTDSEETDSNMDDTGTETETETESESSDSSDDGLGSKVYGDIHRKVLQGFMGNGILGCAGVRELFKKIWDTAGTVIAEEEEMNEIQKVVKQTNVQISKFNFAIKAATCEFSGKMSYVFCVTVDSPIMRIQTTFSKIEVELFKKSLQLMFVESNDFTTPVITCVNLSIEMDGKVTMSQSEVFVDKMLRHQYFVKKILHSDEDDYNLTLGIRAILEMEPVISELYPGYLTHCQLCRRVMLHGLRCPKCPNPKIFHIHCYKKYIKNSKDCPACKSSWVSVTMVTRTKKEVEEDVTDDELEIPKSQANVKSEAGKSDTVISDTEMDTQPTPHH